MYENFSHNDIDLPPSQPSFRIDQVLARYALNNASPAESSLVPKEQEIIMDMIHQKVMDTLPASFTESMKAMVQRVAFTILHTRRLENERSYQEVKDKRASSLEFQIERNLYRRGLASPAQALDTYLDLDMRSAELLKRTDFSSSLPDGLHEGIREMYGAILDHDGSIGRTNPRTRLRYLDVAPGQGKASALLLSRKSDIGRIDDSIITERMNVVIDCSEQSEFPMKWRSLLRKRIATAASDKELSKDEQECIRDELYRDLLEIQNPDNPSQTLSSVSLQDPYVYHLTTTIYAHKAESTTDSSPAAV